eukprot:TRINITY_DN12608_c0_g1_i1.p1 TRINITY_DN12608_c0_g1~~TRINITY_DN12608_c0_g1_i1.p1  ORF type:complete len:272 (-),score=23.65 TRINITY_DN12608_c0_g1_i1:148-963(-)
MGQRQSGHTTPPYMTWKPNGMRLDELPDEMIQTLFVCLANKDLCSFRLVSKRFAGLGSFPVIARLTYKKGDDHSEFTQLSMKCISLIYLNLSPSGVMHGPFTDQDFQSITHGCQQLQELYASFQELITDAALISLGENCHDLRVVDVHYCRLITDNGIQRLMEGAQHLRSLRISQNKLGDASLRAIACHGSEISVLDISGLEQITDSGIEALARGCPALEVLDLHRCAQLTVASAEALVQHCKRLREVNLSGLPQLCKAFGEGVTIKGVRL